MPTPGAAPVPALAAAAAASAPFSSERVVSSRECAGTPRGCMYASRLVEEPVLQLITLQGYKYKVHFVEDPKSADGPVDIIRQDTPIPAGARRLLLLWEPRGRMLPRVRQFEKPPAWASIPTEKKQALLEEHGLNTRGSEVMNERGGPARAPT